MIQSFLSRKRKTKNPKKLEGNLATQQPWREKQKTLKNWKWLKEEQNKSITVTNRRN
jgi:flagellar biosynthesis chaperone FliJ